MSSGCYRLLLMSSVYVTGSYWCLLSMLQACPLNNHLAQDANKNDLDEFSESFTPAIKSVVDFAKGIPGFTLLNQDDQVTLLKVWWDKLSFFSLRQGKLLIWILLIFIISFFCSLKMLMLDFQTVLPMVSMQSHTVWEFDCDACWYLSAIISDLFQDDSW